MSFTWIFALLVGAFILAFTIFALTKFIGNEGQTSDLSSAKEISVLLDPLETSFEEGKITTLATSGLSRIYSDCDSEGPFGNQGIVVNKEIYGKWSDNEEQIKSQDKYLFMNNPAEGKVFILFSKPFYFPFKVASLIYLIPDNVSYCFKEGLPDQMKNELENLHHPQIFVKNSEEWGCKGNETFNVCFSGYVHNCNITVSIGDHDGSVAKRERRVFFVVGSSSIYSKDYSLVYAAIFSDSSLYECQVERLVRRTLSLTRIYEDKLDLPSLEGCNDYIDQTLYNFDSALSSYESSADLMNLGGISEDAWRENKNSPCKIW